MPSSTAIPGCAPFPSRSCEAVGLRSEESLLTQTHHFFYIVYIMPPRDYLGEFEHIVPLAVLRLGDQAYGVTVRLEIEARTRRVVSICAIYPPLDLLEVTRYVQSPVSGPTVL